MDKVQRQQLLDLESFLRERATEAAAIMYGHAGAMITHADIVAAIVTADILKELPPTPGQ